MARCSECGYRIRGKGHAEGARHTVAVAANKPRPFRAPKTKTKATGDK